jgi:hypothetical protein
VAVAGVRDRHHKTFNQQIITLKARLIAELISYKHYKK